MIDTDALKIGDQVVKANGTVLTVWRFDPPGTAGRSYRAGRVVYARVRPGGYGVTFDRESCLYRELTLPTLSPNND